MNNFDVSFIVPTLNENQNIINLYNLVVNSTKGENYTYEIIFVDDQSTDGTVDKINQLINSCNENIKIIQNKVNKGLGYALINGVKISNSKYIIFLDCDVSIEKHDLKKIIKNRKPNCMLIGSRYKKNSKINGASQFKVIISKILNALISFVYNLKISDVSHSLRIFPNVINFDDIKTLTHPGFFWEFCVLFKKKGEIRELPITFNERIYGITKNQSKKLALSVINFFINQIRKN